MWYISHLAEQGLQLIIIFTMVHTAFVFPKTSWNFFFVNLTNSPNKNIIKKDKEKQQKSPNRETGKPGIFARKTICWLSE